VSGPVVVTAVERPDLWAQADGLDADVWPEYNRHGDVLNEYWGRLDEEFADFQFLLYDEDTGEALAQGHTIPFQWDGTAEGLPDGIDGLVIDAFRSREDGLAPTTLSALAIEIPPARQRGGISSLMLAGMREIAAAHRLDDLVAPMRPTWKERYPLVPIHRYARWTREDGLPFDPWIRLHVRLGAEILRTEPESLRITGTVAEWEEWVGMAFPESGDYVFPRGLALLEVDREADLGSYWEPNVWVRHPVG
jgi:hypothetical protein